MLLQHNFVIINCLVTFNIGTLLARDAADNYIVGGNPATKGEFKYYVSIQSNGSHNCGGSLLNIFWILTSASCVKGYDSNSLSIMVGVTNLSENKVKLPIGKVVLYENYTEGPLNDIALIKLKTCLLYNSTIRPIMLKFNEVPPGTKVIMAGFGQTNENEEATSSSTLQQITLNTISNLECLEKLKHAVPICSMCTDNTEGQGYCTVSCELGFNMGDSGGPLILANTKEQVGIASKSHQCAQGNPDIYTRISFYRIWILMTIATDNGGFCTI